MRKDWRFANPVIQEGGILNLQYYWKSSDGYSVFKYELSLSFDQVEVSARIRVQMFGSTTWSDVASVKGYSLQGALIWAEGGVR